MFNNIIQFGSVYGEMSISKDRGMLLATFFVATTHVIGTCYGEKVYKIITAHEECLKFTQIFF